jgi:membrane protease YdiL (CAAX protease family)
MIEEKPNRSLFRTIFISSAENRLRAGWRFTIQTALLLVIAVGGLLIFALIPGINQIDPDSSIRSGIVETLAITGSIILACIWLDKRPFSHLGLELNRRAIVDLLAGILIPLILMGIIFITESSAGWLKVSGLGQQSNSASAIVSGLIFSLILFIGVGWNEELLSRGYELQTIASGMNLFWGVILSSIIFGLLHLGNPNSQNFIMVALGIFMAGVFLAYGYVRTGQLWLSIGLHIGWNFFEGPVFSFPVSGTSTFHLLAVTVNGPDLWTGGRFGPEAGLIVFPVLALGIFLTYLYTRNRKPEFNRMKQVMMGSTDEHSNVV